MIQFPCTCGYRIEVPEELAGTSLQCPECHRLNDVPLLSEIRELEDDGTIKLAPEEEPEVGRAKQQELAYNPLRQDDEGEDYDLRPTFEDVVHAGADEIPLELKDEVLPGAPKYDPETGELIRPLALKGDEYKRVIPLPPVATLSYAQTPDEARIPMWKVPLAMFRPGNAVVILVIALAHLFNLGLWIPVGGGLFFAAFICLFIYMMVFANLAIIVEETGVYEKDEFPTPLRGLDWVDDIWKPFSHFFGAMMITYLPAWYASLRLGTAGQMTVAMPLLLGGSFFFPAVFLTLCTSGSLWNLRPDRVLSVIGLSGLRYLWLVGVWGVAAFCYFSGLLSTSRYVANLMLMGSPMRGVAIPPEISFPLLLAGIVLLHLFCWQLGLLYRLYQPKFPWVLQRHISDKKLERRLPRRRPVYVRPAPPTAPDPRPLKPSTAAREAVEGSP
jgi:hypothetical protein